MKLFQDYIDEDDDGSLQKLPEQYPEHLLCSIHSAGTH
jgi:hypothetical protein